MPDQNTSTAITFIGGGTMASALIGGLLQRGYAASQFHVVEISDSARDQLEKKLGVRSSAALSGHTLAADVVVLAVKPQQLRDAARSLAPLLRNQLVLTIAAGVRIGDLSRWLGGYGRIARAMPNTPALVLAGASAIYATPEVDGTQRSQAEHILACVGSVIWLDDEAQLDAVTAVSGSGPAYVFYFMEAMEEAAHQLGLNANQAKRLVLDTFAGAAKLASASGEPAALLRARVTSKGGTTERALAEFEAARVKQQIVFAVKAAAERSRELGDAFGQSA